MTFDGLEKDHLYGKETIQEFIGKKREMLLVQYALGIKKEEMQKLETIVQVIDI